MWRKIFDKLPASIIITSESGNILSVNNKAITIFGELKNKHISTLDIFDNEKRPFFSDNHYHKMLENKFENIIIQYKTSDSYIYHFLFSSIPITEQKKKYVILYFQNVTEYIFFEKQSEELMRLTIKQDELLSESKSAYKLLGDILWEKFFNNAPESYLLVNSDMQITKINKKAQELLKDEIYIGKDVCTLKFKDKNENIVFTKDNFKKIFNSSYENYEVSLQTKDSQLTYFLLSSKTTFLNDERLLFLSLKNVTEILFFENLFEKQYDDFVSATNKLDNIIIELKNAYKLLKQKDDEILRQLRLAGEIQKNIFSVTERKFKGYSIYSNFKAASIVSGDFFNIWERENNIIDIIIADVTGHGVASALITMMIKMSLETRTSNCEDPYEMLKMIQKDLHPILSKALLFVTLMHARIDTKNDTLSLINCGHVPPIIVKENREVICPHITGLMLGVEDDFDASTYKHQLERGDTVLFYTDGIPEARDVHGKFFEPILFKKLKKMPLEHSKNIVENIFNSVLKFSAEQKLNDDITMICIKKE